MHKEVKKCTDERDIKGLKYIFVDCLDVDPTFEKYVEDYEYCKNLNGLFESHKELTPFSMDKSLWNENYWQKLKIDLLKNFSDKRFKHMIEVAKIVYSDKIKRILKERENSISVKDKKTEAIPTKTTTSSKIEKENSQNTLEDECMRNQREYNKIIAKEKAEKERIERLKEQASQQQTNENSDSKKLMGVVVGMVLIILAIIVITNLI